MAKKTRPGPPATVWPPEKLKLLKKLYPNNDNTEVAKQCKVTTEQVRYAANNLGLKKSNRYWDKPWEDLLLKNWEVMTAVEIAAELKRKFKVDKTRWAVINKYRELNGDR